MIDLRYKTHQTGQQIALVIKDYHAAYPDPVILKRGDPVKIIPRKSDWPGWVWASDLHGRMGWIPESYLETTRGRFRIKNNYDAIELTVKKGDRLKVLKKVAGWLRVRNPYGAIGWIPAENALIVG